MRNITSKATTAFLARRKFTSGNTSVRVIDETVILSLHGNDIARHIDGSGLYINLCGWNTKTTRERLNGLPNVRLHTSKGQAYLNGEPIDSYGWIFLG